VAAAAARA